MQISVTAIKPCDYDSDPNFPKMEALISIYDEEAKFHNSADITVFIDKRDANLSELKKDGIKTAIDFLKHALSSEVAKEITP